MPQDEYEERSPKEERSEIGTPAGESAEKGRERHHTECLTPECEQPEPVRRKNIEKEFLEEDFAEEEVEIATTGGETNTKVRSGISPRGKIWRPKS